MGRSRSRSPVSSVTKKTKTSTSTPKETDTKVVSKKPAAVCDRETKRARKASSGSDSDTATPLQRFKNRRRRRSSSISSSSESSPHRKESRRTNSSRNDRRATDRGGRPNREANDAKDFQKLMDLEKQRWLRQKELETKILEEHAMKRTESRIADRVAEVMIAERVKFQEELTRKLEAARLEMKDQLREEVREEFKWEIQQLQLREEIEKNKRIELERLTDSKAKKLDESEHLLAEERLKLLREKAQLEDERRALKKEMEDWNKSEQRVILNKGAVSRPRLSFALKPS